VAESSVNVTEGSGKRLHTYDRTISSVLIQDQFTLPAEYPYASYVVDSNFTSVATTSAHVLQIMAGASLNVRLRRLRIEQVASATTVAALSFEIMRLTTAGTGGTAITPAKFDTADAASGATAMTLPTAKGTESTTLFRTVLIMRQATAATATQPEEMFEWTQHPGTKPIIIPAGTANGIAVKIGTGVAAATVIVTAEFVETAFV